MRPRLAASLLLLALGCAPTTAPQEAPKGAPKAPAQQILGYRDQLPPSFNPQRDPGLGTLLESLAPLPPEGLLVLGDSAGFLCASLATLRPTLPVTCLSPDKLPRDLLGARKLEGGLKNLQVGTEASLTGEHSAAPATWKLVLWFQGAASDPATPARYALLPRLLAPEGRLFVLLDKPRFDFHPQMRWAPQRVLLQLAAFSTTHPLVQALSPAPAAQVAGCRTSGQCATSVAFEETLCQDLNRLLTDPGLFASLDEHYNRASGYSSELLVLMPAEDASAMQWLLNEYGELFYPPAPAPLGPEEAQAVRQVNHLLLTNLLGLAMERWRYPTVAGFSAHPTEVATALQQACLRPLKATDPFADCHLLGFTR